MVGGPHEGVFYSRGILRSKECFGARWARARARSFNRVDQRDSARRFRHFILFTRGARIVMRLIMFFRRVVDVVHGGEQTMVFPYLLSGGDGINGRLGRPLFFFTRFGADEGLTKGRGAQFNDFAGRELGADVDVLGGQTYVAVRVSELFQVGHRVFAHVCFRGRVFRYARASSANGVVDFFLYRAVRFTGFL